MKPLDAARAIGPELAARSAEIEAARTLPTDIAERIRDAELFKVCVPRSYGGAELDPSSCMAVTEELAYHDGAAGWCQMIGSTTGLLAGFLPPEHAEALFDPADAIGGGLAAPMGEATRVDGGVRVSGRWQWGSGTRHCTAIGGGVRFDGPPHAAFTFFDRADVELLDTWHVAGLKGTGSTDYVLSNAFVPEGRWVQLPGASAVETGPLYRFSFFGLLAAGVASVALGLARRAVDEVVALAAVKSPQGSSRPLAERAPVQAEVAQAEATALAARALLDDVLGEAWAHVLAGDDPTDEHRRRIRLAATHATTAAAASVDRCYTAAGGAAVYESSPLQRVFRDVHVATQHAMVAPRTFELAGRLRLGLETDTRQL